jgi:hypothetical protein
LKELDYEKSKIAYTEDSEASILFRREKREQRIQGIVKTIST